MYSTWNIKQLKDELRNRGASLRGNKADLIERLVLYDHNFNFGQPRVEDDDEPSMELPPIESYRDINSNTKLPPLNKTLTRHYLSISDKKMEKILQLYESRHLVTARSCTLQNMTYLKGICRKTMKTLHYEVNIKLDDYGNIEEAHCECPAGSGTTATCKHVGLLLLGVENMVDKKIILLFETCTQKLQSLHAPKKPYSGTPVRAEKLPRKKQNMSVLYEPYPIKFINKQEYNSRVRNSIINFPNTTMPLKQMYRPANPYGIEKDHDYLELDLKTKVLSDLLLLSISEEQINAIEEATRGQTCNKEWHNQRKIRMTASNYHTICHLKSSSMKSYASQMHNRREFFSRATSHGIVNENVALQKYCEQYDLHVLPSGLHVSQERPYLAASPDGLLGPDTIIEIKCPFTSRYKTIDPVNVPYLTLNDDVLQIKRNTPYYFQIQGQWYCTGRKYCNLIIYTYKDMKVVFVNRDEPFIMLMLTKLDIFYNSYFIKEVLNNYAYYCYNRYSKE